MAYTELLPSGKYRAIYRDRNGKRRSAGTFTHKKAAQKEASAAEIEAAKAGWRDPKAALRPWGEWANEWWPTWDGSNYPRRNNAPLRAAKERFGKMALADITRFEVKAWAAELLKSGLAPSTVKSRIYLLSVSLGAAIDADIITTNPAHGIDIDNPVTGDRHYLTGLELLRLFAHLKKANQRAFDLCVIQLAHGLRWGEIAGLQIKRIDRARGQITVAEVWNASTKELKPYPKGKKRRTIPTPEWALPSLERQIGERKDGFLFPGEMYDAIQYGSFYPNFFEPASERARLGDIGTHALRHTYASMLIQNGLHLPEIGFLLGHVSWQTTEGYADIDGIPNDPILTKLATPIIDLIRGARGANMGKTVNANPGFRR